MASFPIGLTGAPQWHRISLVPFTDPADKILDLGVNLLMFIPFGYSFAARSGGLLRLAGAAALTSMTAELLQLFSTIRYPSSTDVVYAVVGALLGATVRLWVVRARKAD